MGTPARAPKKYGITWHHTNRHVGIHLDQMKNKHEVVVEFTKVGYDGDALRPVTQPAETIVVATGLTYARARFIKQGVEAACDAAYAQGHTAARRAP